MRPPGTDILFLRLIRNTKIKPTINTTVETKLEHMSSDHNYNQSDNRRKLFHSLRWQILSIAVIGTLGFFVFLAVMLTESKDSADLLRDIRDTRYPVQERLIAAHHGLQAIDSNIEQAIATSSSSLLDHSMALSGEFRAHLHSAMTLTKSRSGDLNDILTQFDEYYRHSFTLAKSVIIGEKSPYSIASEKQQIAREFNSVVTALGDMQTEQTDNLVSSVDTATQKAAESLRAGVTTGILTAVLLFMVGLFTTRSILNRINNMVSSLRQIATGNGDMGVRIPLTGSDEMTELAHWFNTFIERLQNLTTESTAEIKRLAFTDTLTNLPNRRMFLNCLDEEIEHLSNTEGKSLAVMFLDLDNFKPVNDQFGHDAGDELLRVVAQRLVATVRDTDNVASNFGTAKINSPGQAEKMLDHKPGQSVVARLAGDEFMLIISNLDNQEQAITVAQRIRQAMMQPVSIEGNDCKVGVSIGICLYPDNASNADKLINNADVAMYNAKNNGKNKYRLYDPELKKVSDRKIEMEKAIKTAVQNDELTLLYQPKFRLKDQQLVGAEALLRWKSNSHGTFSPADFISIAEANGAIRDFDDWVMRTVIDQLAQWESSDIDPVEISLNFSALQASRPKLADAMKDIAGDKKHLMQQIEIEITETSAIENITVVEENILNLKMAGMKIAMDDFGAGHSSLTLLTRCPIDTLKIDKEVIQEIHRDKRSRIIVQSMIDLAASLDVTVCAEGIENKDQARALSAMNCKYGQGYYFSEPLSAAQLTTLMEVQHRNSNKAA